MLFSKIIKFSMRENVFQKVLIIYYLSVINYKNYSHNGIKKFFF